MPIGRRYMGDITATDMFINIMMRIFMITDMTGKKKEEKLCLT